MKIDKYTYKEFMELAQSFHGYPAPGLIIGGYMVALAKKMLPPETLFDAIVETPKCLPDAVQLLSFCSIGNGWMKVLNIGRYAVSLYNKYTGEGVRVYLDTAKVSEWSEINSWFFKLKPKKEQDSELLYKQIQEAGDTICSTQKVKVQDRFLVNEKSAGFMVCPVCNEAYPKKNGGVCRGCQGEDPYQRTQRSTLVEDYPELKTVAVQDAVGKEILHDITQIIPGESKGAAFIAGQEITAGDVCRLQQMGKNQIYLKEENFLGEEWIHENDAVLGFAKSMAGEGVIYTETPSEGKVSFYPQRDGLLVIDREGLEKFNLVPDVMCAARHSYIVVGKDKAFAGARAIPLYLSRENYLKALTVMEKGSLFKVLPLRKAKVGILVTGTEVFKGIIEDKFKPVISGKVEALGCSVVGYDVVPDERKDIEYGVRKLLEKRADLIVTTAGMSVDPDDVTRQGLQDAGIKEMLYGTPLLPGAMTLIGKIGSAQVIGVPACALYYKTTSFDLLLPRLLAGLKITRLDIAQMAEGGFCLNCKTCTFPKCPFGK